MCRSNKAGNIRCYSNTPGQPKKMGGDFACKRMNNRKKNPKKKNGIENLPKQAPTECVSKDGDLKIQHLYTTQNP